MKIHCILGVLDTPRGHEIKEELINWFSNDYEIECVVHDGSQYEYSAIKRAIELSVESNAPVLYIHTKGAWNINPALTKNDEKYYMCPQCHPPKDAIILDWQKTVRKMWRSEFVDNKEWYINQCSTAPPTVCAPYVSDSKHTWTNAFMFNASAAKQLYPLKFNTNRWSYEKLWNGTSCQCTGRVFEHMNSYPAMYSWKSDVWTYF